MNAAVTFFLRLRLICMSMVEVMLAGKIIPIVFMSLYVAFCWKVWEWFAVIPHPDGNQTIVITTVLGLATGMITWFTSSGLQNINWERIDSIHSATRAQLSTKLLNTKKVQSDQEENK